MLFIPAALEIHAPIRDPLVAVLVLETGVCRQVKVLSLVSDNQSAYLEIDD